jgi:hypothetical protein
LKILKTKIKELKKYNEVTNRTIKFNQSNATDKIDLLIKVYTISKSEHYMSMNDDKRNIDCEENYHRI